MFCPPDSGEGGGGEVEERTIKRIGSNYLFPKFILELIICICSADLNLLKNLQRSSLP